MAAIVAVAVAWPAARGIARPGAPPLPRKRLAAADPIDVVACANVSMSIVWAPELETFSRSVLDAARCAPFEGISALSNAVLDLVPDDDGLWLEFGVWRGGTMRTISNYRRGHARRMNVKAGLVYGFDSFAGLPVTWRKAFGPGRFALDGAKPPFPENDVVKWVKGWFNETLPPFLDEHTAHVSLLHVDSDLYVSASIILTELSTRKRIRPNATVIVFDELMNYPQ